MSNKRELSFLKKAPNFDEAFVFSFVRYGEADCVVRLLLKSKGKASFFYRNGLLSSVNKPFKIQAPCFAKAAYILSNNNMHKLIECDPEPDSFMLASTLKNFGMGLYLAEIVELFLPEEEAAPIIFELLKDVFQSIFNYGFHPQLLRAFELKLLEYAGYLPDFQEDEVKSFDPVACAFLPVQKEGCLDFSQEALKLSIKLLASPVDKIFCLDNDPLLKVVGRIFQSRLRLLGKYRLKSVDFLQNLKKIKCEDP